MTGKEFLERMKTNDFPQVLCGCGCGKPLEPRVDGERQKIGGKEVNDDCYYDSLSEVIEKYPIRKPR